MESASKVSGRVIEDLDQRWFELEKCLRVFVSLGSRPGATEEEHLRVLCSHGMSKVLQLWLVTFIEKEIALVLDKLFQATTNLCNISLAFEAFYEDVNRMLVASQWLGSHCEAGVTRGEAMDAESLEKPVNNLPRQQSRHVQSRSLEDSVLEVVGRISSARVTPQFDSLMLSLFQRAFRAFHKLQSGERLHTAQCPGCDVDTTEDDSECNCSHIMQEFIRINQVLGYTRGFSSLVHDCIESVAFEQLRRHVAETCRDDFESACFAALKLWLEETVSAWLRTIAGSYSSNLSTFKDRLYYFLLDIFVDFRAGQLFDMIVDFPDSEPALKDLKDCLQKAPCIDSLVSRLRDAMERRLFHPGVKTADIITAYVSTIKALRVLDPSGLILQSVCEPLSSYLRSRDNRDNTVRIIVSSLTDENNVELNAELARCSQKSALDSCEGSSDEEGVDGDWRTWVPRAKVSRMIRSSDIVTLLVNIYGSQEVFVEEYGSLMAERLLNGTWDTQKEVLYIELLKIRFGEIALNNCEVMLNDVRCSKRLHFQITQEKLRGFLTVPLTVLVVSAQFWPEMRDDAIRIPPEVFCGFHKFRLEYELLNGNRTVTLKPQYGWVELELDFNDGSTKSFKCTTGQAALISLFHGLDEWRITDLVTMLECSRVTVKRLASFWIAAGVLREYPASNTNTGDLAARLAVVAGAAGSRASDGESDTVQYEANDNNDGHTGSIFDDEESNEDYDHDGGNTPRVSQQMETRYQVYWGFVRGLLTNLGQAALDRIFSMLSMFVSSASQEFTLQDCKQFLDSKVRSNELMYQGGVYTLPK